MVVVVMVVMVVMVMLSISSHALPAFFLSLSLPSLSLLSAPNIPPLHNQTPPQVPENREEKKSHNICYGYSRLKNTYIHDDFVVQLKKRESMVFSVEP